MKKILITTSMERATRILLRTDILRLLKQDYEIIVASPAEISEKWKQEFEDIIFLYDYMRSLGTEDFKEAFLSLEIDAILSCSNTDVPVMAFDVEIQRVAKSMNIPIIIVQDFIDAIFHPMPIKPDLYLCWGEFFKRMFSRKRDVLKWNAIGSLYDMDVEEPLDNVKIVGVPHFDIYRKADFQSREEYVKKLDLDINKPIFLYLPNGEISQWVYETFENLMEAAIIFNAQVVIKSHPIRIGDNWIYNLITKRYKDIKVLLLNEPSIGKGTACGCRGYDCNIYHLDMVDMWSLGNVLFNSDIVCSIPSTTALEAMLFNRPVILETSRWSHPHPVREKVMRWWWGVLDSYKCCDRSLQYGELFNFVEDNLKNPDKNINGRALLVNEMFAGVNGDGCENIYNSIKEFLG